MTEYLPGLIYVLSLLAFIPMTVAVVILLHKNSDQ